MSATNPGTSSSSSLGPRCRFLITVILALTIFRSPKSTLDPIHTNIFLTPQLFIYWRRDIFLWKSLRLSVHQKSFAFAWIIKLLLFFSISPCLTFLLPKECLYITTSIQNSHSFKLIYLHSIPLIFSLPTIFHIHHFLPIPRFLF